MTDRPAKRVMDVVFSSMGLILLSLVFIVVGILVKVSSRGPVIFRQTRVGLKGRHFTIYKFRTMVEGAPQIGPSITVGRDERITRVGRWLRATKLDELPQLFNVLIGDMSLVGPRPEVPEYVTLYTPEQQRVLELKPGITDPASIHYRDEGQILAFVDTPHSYYVEVIMVDKIRINLAYAEGATVKSDFTMLFKTIARVFSGAPRLDKGAE